MLVGTLRVHLVQVMVRLSEVLHPASEMPCLALVGSLYTIYTNEESTDEMSGLGAVWGFKKKNIKTENILGAATLLPNFQSPYDNPHWLLVHVS